MTISATIGPAASSPWSVVVADVVRDSGGVKEREEGRKMTRKKKSEMASPPLPPMPNVKRTVLLLLLGLIAVLHFGKCDSLTVVDNEGK